MPRYAARVDANHKQIVETLRARGWVVFDASRVSGFVDLVCGRQGRLELVEVKDGSKPKSAQKYTEKQERLHADLLRAGVVVKTLRSVRDAELL